MAYKPKPIKTTVGAAISDAFAEFQSLAEEMRETYDNMESANMGHMSKCEAAGEAADELEQHNSEPDVPEGLAELEFETTEQVNADRRKGPSRDVRLSNALNLIQSAKEALDGIEDPSIDADDGDVDQAAQDRYEAAEALSTELDEHADFDVSFPGMYG